MKFYRYKLDQWVDKPIEAPVSVRISVYGHVEKDGKLLMIREQRTWETPGGGVEIGENLTTALEREILEESGYQVKVIDQQPVHVADYRHFQEKRGFVQGVGIFYRAQLLKNETQEVSAKETEEVAWMTLDEMTSENIHPYYWEYIKTLK